MRLVTTVRGRVAVQDLGITDAHSHAWIEPAAGVDLADLIHNDVAGISADLTSFRACGGRALVDCQPGLCGRNGNMLRVISEATDVHIVASTGFHLRRYYPQEALLWKMTVDEAAAFFLDEVQWGLFESRENSPPVYPGLIKIAAEASMDASPMHLFEAAVEVSRQTRLAIAMHTEKGAAVEEFLDYFTTSGLAPERLIFCHVDKRPDFGLHRELAAAGVLLEYDTFVRPKYKPDLYAWPLLEQMIAAGLSKQVALATDLALASQWCYSGGSPGPASFLTIIRERLAACGYNQEVIAGFMGGTVGSRLAIPS
ncbi:MAG: hypothetical protein R3293_07800 [Candidatus Promineifilaceae bacterium]|nr:hypothetical protein [Candidatus Promineifilaceae bacterium]